MFITFLCFVTWVVNGLLASNINDLFASSLISFHLFIYFSWTRGSASVVNWSPPRLPLHPHSRHSCRFVFTRSLLTPPWLPAPTSTHSLSLQFWLCSCSFLPRGEELSPIITQVSVKWIVGRLTELHDGKHPSWVVWLSVLSPLLHPSADAQGWHACMLRATAGENGVWSGDTVHRWNHDNKQENGKMRKIVTKPGLLLWHCLIHSFCVCVCFSLTLRVVLQVLMIALEAFATLLCFCKLWPY